MKPKIENFCVFILSHKRADNLVTYSLLKRCGYDGPLFILIDSDDPTSADYVSKFGEIVIYVPVEDSESDSFDNFGRHAVLHARNECFNIAERLGFEYFLQLDDDYNGILFRYPIESSGIVKWKGVLAGKTLTEVFAATLELFKESGATSLAFSQGGDWLGGNKADICDRPRKCMNSFFCCTKRRFDFIGRANEDVNSYVLHGSRGLLFLTVAIIQVNQKTTQKQKGGTTDVYLDEGTFVKSFYPVLCSPSSVVITMMGSSHRRFHHRINWDCAVPMILSESYKKQ